MRDKHDSGATGDGGPDAAPRQPATAREARLAAALRDNLRRRKNQARGRRAGEAEASSTVSGASDGQPPSK
jgi:hypothetical protein